MSKQLIQYQPSVLAVLTDLLSNASQDFPIFQLDKEYLRLVNDLSVKGKQFRGCLLVGFFNSLGAKNFSQQALELAAAVELYGSALLIHDDIMDKADMRRGLPALHHSLEALATQRGYKNAAHFGVSGALCLGDFLFFLADEVLATLQVPAVIKQALTRTSASELAHLGIAQIEDMRLASMNEPITKQHILEMYIGKTGRYTGRWPLELAVILAEGSTQVRETIGEVGDQIGLLYQLVDDKLGLFGEEAVIGKSVTGDILEGKKTLYYYYLQENKFDLSSFGDRSLTVAAVNQIKKVIIDSGIAEQVDKDIEEIQTQLLDQIAVVDIPQSAQAFLRTTVELVVNRKK